MVSPKWTNNIHRFWRVNGRLSVLQLQSDKSKQRKIEGEKYSSLLVGNKLIVRKSEPVDHMVNIINVYAPTSDKVEKNSTEIESLYGEVEKLLTKFRKLKSSVTFIAGDFNSKVGKRENE